jgi:hypothetical protein
MPAVPGSIYYITSYVSNFKTTAGAKAGSDVSLQGATTTVVTVDNGSPVDATITATRSNTSLEKMYLTYTLSSDIDISSVLLLQSSSLVTNAPTDGVAYSVNDIIGASTVVCANSAVFGNTGFCTYTPSRSINNYFKLFTKDSSGNYSLGVAPSNQPFLSGAPHGGARILEVEVITNATTTVTGGSTSGGGDGTGTTTTATTTVATSTPGKSGGSGDVGFNWDGTSQYAVDDPSFMSSFFSLLNHYISGSSEDVYAAGSDKMSSCTISFVGYCFIK